MNNVIPKLPPGWVMVRIGDLCEKNTGTCDPRENPEVPFVYVDISGVDNSQKKVTKPKKILGKDAPSRARQLIRCNDVIVSTTRPNLNAVALIPKELDGQICSTGFCVLRVKEGLDSEYLFAFVRSQEFVSNLSELVKGALYPAVTDGQVRSQFIPLPPTIKEQQRIVAWLNEKLEAVEQARTAAEDQLSIAKKWYSAYLHSYFDGPESRGWEQKTLGEICRDISDGTHFTPTYLPHGIPFLSVKDVRETGISFNDCRFISPEQHQELCKRCRPEKGDVLYTKVGTTGIAKAIDVDREFSIFVSVALLKLGPSVRPDYLEKVLNSPIGKEQAERYTQGMANRNLVLQDMRRITIPIPPLEKQQEIAIELSNRMAAIEKLKRTLDEQMNLLSNLPAAFFRRALSGEPTE